MAPVSDAGSGDITSWSDVKGAYLTEFVEADLGEFGMTMTDGERAQLWDRSGATAASSGVATTPGAPSAEAAGPKTEMIDLDRLDLEELTKRLYQRLRANLRRELLVDRERAGRLNDVR
jgi:hypothetical protein